jgi:hypothetical protein
MAQMGFLLPGGVGMVEAVPQGKEQIFHLGNIGLAHQEIQVHELSPGDIPVGHLGQHRPLVREGRHPVFFQEGQEPEQLPGDPEVAPLLGPAQSLNFFEKTRGEAWGRGPAQTPAEARENPMMEGGLEEVAPIGDLSQGLLPPHVPVGFRLYSGA